VAQRGRGAGRVRPALLLRHAQPGHAADAGQGHGPHPAHEPRGPVRGAAGRGHDERGAA
ncbi:unnamed protein product, partial [Heterosigma akashiwo]